MNTKKRTNLSRAIIIPERVWCALRSGKRLIVLLSEARAPPLVPKDGLNHIPSCFHLALIVAGNESCFLTRLIIFLDFDIHAKLDSQALDTRAGCPDHKSGLFRRHFDCLDNLREKLPVSKELFFHSKQNLHSVFLS